MPFEAELLGSWVAASRWHADSHFDQQWSSVVMCGRAMVQHHPVSGAALFVHHTLSKRRVPRPWAGCGTAAAVSPQRPSPVRLDPSIAPLGGREWRENAFLVDENLLESDQGWLTMRAGSGRRQLGKLGPPGPHCITSSQQLSPVPPRIMRVEQIADGAMRELAMLAAHDRSWLPCSNDTDTAQTWSLD